ncbi:MAG: hypothetical protein M0R17_02110 [Candidatus Omnitrophica bacterium]|jgi:hypothetical protein|nr:hypothetical protein [Candidatus Omnitrophota bacterium]
MNFKQGNLWVWHKLGSTIVIPTNEGWKHDGSNVMGAGLAKEAREVYTELPKIYGRDCQLLTSRVYYPDYRLILVPSKPLNVKSPHLSWQGNANINTVTKSLKWLQDISESLPEKVYVPLIGAGNGQLDPELIKELMDKILISEKFIGVTF